MPSTADSLQARAETFRSSLLAWYRANRRTLPWREAPSLYKTVVSELMLQQTQIKTALPYFARWLDELPDFTALAAAPEEQVLKLWEGLGYYSRARNLHKLARAVVAMPSPPKTPDAWRELPGIGPYTAAAITSITFGAQAACVDGNVVRILARLTADSTEFRDSSSAAKVFTPLAQALLNPTEPGDHNQAMMELGATICTKANPACDRCPVQALCAGQNAGSPESLPRLAAKRIERREVTRVWCVHGGRLLLHRATGQARRLAHLHELPAAEHLGLAPAHFTGVAPLAQKRRSITRFQITETIYPAPSPRGDLADGLVWVPLAELENITLSGPHRRWVQELLAKGNTRAT
jgi:A/G-specific adenine glycosylase